MLRRASYNIAITGVPPSVSTALRRALRVTLRRHRVTLATLSVSLVDDATIAKLNKKHLNHSGPTDVLSFDLRDPAETRGAIDGELVISLDTARREAKERGHPLTAELGLYAIHGLLHQLGYDDSHPTSAARMHAMEAEALAAAGIKGDLRNPVESIRQGKKTQRTAAGGARLR